MYSGGAVSQFREERPPASFLHRLKKETQKQRAAEPLTTHLSLLHHLAQHDLNFQNLLLLHNLIQLASRFEDLSIPSDNRFTNGSRQKNCLEVLVDCFGKQPTTNLHRLEHRPQTRCIAGEHRTKASYQTKNGLNVVPERGISQGVVIGRPIFAYQRMQLDDSNGMMWCSSHGNGFSENPSKKWMHSMWNPWYRMDIPPSEYHPACKDRDFQQAPAIGMSRVSSLETHYSYDDGDTQLCDETISMNRCNSMPAWIDEISNEVMKKEMEGSADVDEYQPQAYQYDSHDVGKIEWDLCCPSESIVDMDGLSDLERFMKAATPKFYPPCPLHSIPEQNITMDNIWQYYDLPSLHGLQVPFIKGGQTVNFAHFTPTLSAIRLFVPAIRNLSEDAFCRCIYISNGSQYPEYMHLAFEFFETMKTHVRRPLSQEIENLFNVGVAGNCLPNLRLSEIHPSSWFSIAWHPIYCIPEGKLKTSFLTFHRFGTSQAINDQTFKSQCVLEAPLIGIKFCGLHPEAWLRIQGDHYANKKENMSLDSYPSDHMNHSKNNNATEYQAAEVSSSESPTLAEASFDLVEMIEHLQYHAELLARERIRRLNRSGNPVEPHQCYHSDFEFFHQQS